MKQKSVQREEGQSLIIIAILLVVLIALVGLVVDAGNAYAQRRIVQNAVDAAALAGAQELAKQDDWKLDPDDPDLYLYNQEVLDAVKNFAERNGIDYDTLAIYYADIDGNILYDAQQLGTGFVIKEDSFGGVRAEAIIVEGNLPFPTYLVRVIGRNEMMASASAQAILACGACSAGDPVDGGLFPIAVYVGLFDQDGGFPAYGKQYTIWEKEVHFPGTGSFGWLSWNTEGGHTSQTTLKANMEDTSRSGRWSVDDFIPTGPGVMNSSGVRTELQYRIDNRIDLDPPRPVTVTLPIFDYTTGTGANLKYHAVGFGNFRIDCYHFSKTKKYGDCTFDPQDNSKWISGTFVKGLIPSAKAGCSNYGVCASEITPPLEVKRVLQGRVVPWRIFVEQTATPGESQPIDLVHVLDTSGSMCCKWNGTSDCDSAGYGSYGWGNYPIGCLDNDRPQGRLDIAIDGLTWFNEALYNEISNSGWDPNNQLGLVTYPGGNFISSSKDYSDCYLAFMERYGRCNSGCSIKWNTYKGKTYHATKNQALTNINNYANINAAIEAQGFVGFTSMGVGMHHAREMVTDPATHDPNNLQVIVFTTDGLPNVKSDGHLTGYGGTGQPNPPKIVETGCNLSAEQAVIQQANEAKQQGVVIFTIGIAEPIDVELMKAFASADTHPDKPHFFQATTPGDFQLVYEAILGRLPTLGSEECIADENAAEGDYAWVYLYDEYGNPVASTQASSTGDYKFEDIEPGLYQLTATWTDTSVNPWVEYDVMTWTLGGDEAMEPIWIEIPLGKQETEKNLYLRTNHEFTCGE